MNMGLAHQSPRTSLPWTLPDKLARATVGRAQARCPRPPNQDVTVVVHLVDRQLGSASRRRPSCPSRRPMSQGSSPSPGRSCSPSRRYARVVDLLHMASPSPSVGGHAGPLGLQHPDLIVQPGRAAGRRRAQNGRAGRRCPSLMSVQSWCGRALGVHARRRPRAARGAPGAPTQRRAFPRPGAGGRGASRGVHPTDSSLPGPPGSLPRKPSRRSRMPPRHSSSVTLYMTVSRRVPSRRCAWRRTTPSFLAPRRSIAACDRRLRISVLHPTTEQPEGVEGVLEEAQLARRVHVGALPDCAHTRCSRSRPAGPRG